MTNVLWYCRDWRLTRKRKNCWIKSLFYIFFAHKKYYCSFINWCHMDWCPYYVSGPWTCQLRCCLCRVRKLSDFIKNILICVPKMNKGLTGLERHGGEYDIIFIFGWTIPLRVVLFDKFTQKTYYEQCFLVWTWKVSFVYPANPISWKYVSIARVYGSIWCTIYMQKLTLSCIWYAMGRIGVWGRCIYAKTAYHMHANKLRILCTSNTCVSYAHQSQFLIFCWYLAYYLYAFSWDQAHPALQIIQNVFFSNFSESVIILHVYG